MPQEAFPHIELGKLWLKLNQFETAEKNFKAGRAVYEKISPTGQVRRKAVVDDYLGRTYMKQKRHLDALAAFEASYEYFITKDEKRAAAIHEKIETIKQQIR